MTAARVLCRVILTEKPRCHSDSHRHSHRHSDSHSDSHSHNPSQTLTQWYPRTGLGTCVGFGPTQLPVGPNPNPKPNPKPNPNPKWIDQKLGGPEFYTSPPVWLKDEPPNLHRTSIEPPQNTELPP